MGERRKGGKIGTSVFPDDSASSSICTMHIPNGVDKESKKIISARILSKLVVSVAKGNSNYVSKFQLSSSNGLGDIPVFVTKIDDQKGDRFHHLFVENLAPAEIARVQELSEAKFSKSKKRIENLFF